jgi:MerR family transcriptional regulator, light-induced transcriptional regulator
MSATLRHLLGSFLRLYGRGEQPPRLLFATPSGERHEIGILAAAMLAASQGLSVTYLGPELPGSEIVAAANASGAHVLVLGLTLPGTPQPRDRELKKILRDLARGIDLWAGGAGTAAYQSLVGARGLVLSDFDSYAVRLARLSGHVI